MDVSCLPNTDCCLSHTDTSIGYCLPGHVPGVVLAYYWMYSNLPIFRQIGAWFEILHVFAVFGNFHSVFALLKCRVR